MSKSITHKQFLKMWYNRMGIKNKAVENRMEEIYDGLIEVIREELRTKGELNIKNLGKFYVIETGGYEIKNNSDVPFAGNYFVEKHYLPKFKCSQTFKDYINYSVVSKEGRRKIKNGTWTSRDEEMLLDEPERRRANVRKMLERKKNTGETFHQMVNELGIKVYTEMLDDEDDD